MSKRSLNQRKIYDPQNIC